MTEKTRYTYNMYKLSYTSKFSTKKNYFHFSSYGGFENVVFITAHRMQTGDLNMDAVTATSIMDMAESTDMPMATDSDELVPSLQVNM